MCLLSCYNWNNSSNAGVFACNLNNNRNNSNNNVGLRADSYFYLIDIIIKVEITGIVDPRLQCGNIFIQPF